MAEVLSLTANAKINIGLIVKGRRPDGYHLLETYYYPISLADEISLTPSGGDDCAIEMKGLDEIIPPEKNLCWRAWRLLREAFPGRVGGVKIKVTKAIPAGAGLGGGSSDAATVLRGLKQLFLPELNDVDLIPYAIQLGADVPFFIYNKPMFGSGIGEILEPLAIPIPFEIRWVLPGVFSSTPQAFKELDWSVLDTSTDLKTILHLPVEEWKTALRNDLEGPVFRKFPQLKAIKEDLYANGAVYASMSGSGSAIFGIFPQGAGL